MKKGFTLIELSIVLVIIGLLIGGILVGQSLIESAKIQKLAQQIQQYDAATASFKSRFRNIPGDSSSINGLGNGDGYLNDDSSPPFYGPISTIDGAIDPNGVVYGVYAGDIEMGISGERAYFWSDLAKTSLTLENLSSPNTDTSSGIFHSEHVPESALGNSGIYTTYATGVFSTDPTNRHNIYIITGNEGSTNAALSIANGASTFTEALAIDKKLDDGIPTSGNLVNIRDNSGSSCIGTLLSNPMFSDNPQICTILIKLFSQTGDI